MNQVEYKGDTYEVQKGFLDLGLLEITNIEEIHGLDKIDIKHLELSSNDITEIKGLESLTSLEILNCSSNQLEHISGLSELKNLKILHLVSNQFSKPSIFEN